MKTRKAEKRPLDGRKPEKRAVNRWFDNPHNPLLTGENNHTTTKKAFKKNSGV
jgi:hypothetical protein